MENHSATSTLARVFSGEASEAEAENVAVHLPGCRQCWERAVRVVAELRDQRSLLPASSVARAVVAILEGERVSISTGVRLYADLAQTNRKTNPMESRRHLPALALVWGAVVLCLGSA